MATITASEARKRLFPLIEEINKDGHSVVVTSRAGNVVMISEDEFNALEETAHLLRSPANAAWLAESLAQLPDRVERELTSDPE